MEEKRDIDIELKSDQMNEMLSNPPSWITRSGNGVFLIALFIVIALAWFIRYPDEIGGEVLVTSSQAPIEFSNQSYIQLKTLNVRENQEVNPGDLIAQFDIQASQEDILKATSYLNILGKLESRFPSFIPEFKERVYLGTFQEQWTILLSNIQSWNTEHTQNVRAKELAFIQKEISYREQLQTISGKKILLSEGEYELIEEQLAGSERLAEQHAISKQTLNQDKRLQTQAMQTVQIQREQQVQNLIALNSLRKDKLRLEHETRLEKLQQSAEIKNNLAILRTSFQNWEKNAAWVAPCSGKVIFNKLLQVNRFYKANEASVVIVPKGKGYQATALISSAGAGKLKIGQKAFIELTDYPKAEFGMLEGKVSHQMQIDRDGKYEVQIILSNQLKTTYNKEIPPKAQLKGKVKIITKDKRLLMRFFEQLTDLIK